MWHGIFTSCVTGQIRQKSGDIYSTEFWIACNVPWAHETWNFQRIPIQGHWQPVPLHSPADRQISYRWGHRRALWKSLQCWATFPHKYRKQETKGLICNFIQRYSVECNHLGMPYVPPACSLWIFFVQGRIVSQSHPQPDEDTEPILRILLPFAKDRGVIDSFSSDETDRTPLYVAIEENRPTAAKLLLDHGADPWVNMLLWDQAVPTPKSQAWAALTAVECMLDPCWGPAQFYPNLLKNMRFWHRTSRNVCLKPYESWIWQYK